MLESAYVDIHISATVPSGTECVFDSMPNLQTLRNNKVEDSFLLKG